MSLARLLRTIARRALTDPLGMVRLVLTRLVDEPAHVLVRSLGLLPAGPRAGAARILEVKGRVFGRLLPRAGWPLLFRLAALDAAGRRPEALDLAARRGPACRAAGRMAVAGWLAEVDRAEQGLELIAPLPAVPRVQRVRGRVRWRAGDWVAARDELAAAAAADPRPTTLRMLDRIHQDLRAVTPGWLPDIPSPAARGIVAAMGRTTPGRAVHLINNSLPHLQTGYTVRAQRIALAQRDHGIDPVMVTKLGFPWRQGIGDAPQRAEVDGVPYLHVPDPGGDTIFGTAERVDRAVERAGPLIAAERPAVLHPTTPFDNAQLALALGRHLDVPVVYELRGFLEETWVSRAGSPDAIAAAAASDRYRLTRDTEGWLAAQAAHVVTLGEAMKADLVTRGVAAERITVVPNAVELDTFTPSPDRAAGRRVRAQLAIPDERVVLGYISSLVPYEGVEVLLRGARELLDRGSDIEVVVVGDGTARAGWEREAAELGLAGRCRFTGRVPHAQIQGYYEAIDVFVVPRRDERVCRLVTPLKPVEAMALERCTVVSDLPALAEMVEEGVTGRTFAAEDPVALADVVAPLVADPALRRTLGAAARERVAQERTWDANGRRYLDIYRSIGAI